MSLSAYKQKRSPGKTPEPFGGKSAGTQLHFVIQKHAASHLHYDFRLEMGGVLKSWAVPKGPSLDPGIKRLAMMVEDHPFDYRNFEGIIPEGQYGGGTVMVWDEGTYEPAEIKEKDRKAQEKSLLHQLYSGKLKFTLHGKKLKGMFALVKAAARGENGWLLMKLDDKYAGKEDITLKDKSVRSKKTIEQIAHSATNIYSSSAKKKGRSTGAVKTAKKAATIPEPVKKIKKKIAPIADSTKPAGSRLKRLLDKATEQAFYTSVKPMLATLVDKPFDDEGWLYEIKWDGYRAVSFMNNNKIELKSRNDKSFNDKYYPVHEALKDWPVDAIVDGEIVVVKENGHADFASLQNWRSEADGTLLYYLFDILWYNGYNVTHLPLTNRKAILKELLPADSIIKASDDFETSGIEFLEAARKMGLEGIMAKRKDSKYLTGGRSREWLKIKANKRQEVVIGGYTNNVDSSKPFSSLLVGVFEKGKFIYTGKIGTGFNIQ